MVEMLLPLSIRKNKSDLKERIAANPKNIKIDFYRIRLI